MKTDADNVRYSLERKGNRMLYVFGVNPSTATDKKPDRTMQKVLGFAERNGFDGFAMMNLYPLRSTNPRALPKVMDEELHQRNLMPQGQVSDKNFQFSIFNSQLFFVPSHSIS